MKEEEECRKLRRQKLIGLRTSVTGLDLGTGTKEEYYLSTQKLKNNHAQDKEHCDQR